MRKFLSASALYIFAPVLLSLTVLYGGLFISNPSIVIPKLFAQSIPFPGPGNSASGGCVPSTVFLTTTGSGTWTNSTGCTEFGIQVLGAGGSGGTASGNYAAGGGGGAFGKKVTQSIAAGASVGYNVGAGGPQTTTASTVGTAGGDTWFCNSTSNCASITGTAVTVGAKGGGAGSSSSGGGGQGGQATTSSGLGDVKFTAGNGAARINGVNSGGGGGAAGTAGAGGNGNTNGTGGTADNGTVSGGTVGDPPGACASGTEFDGSHGSGGGGGGTNNVNTDGGSGCAYGGGGAGGGSASAGNGDSGAGGNGLIVITPRTTDQVFNLGTAQTGTSGATVAITTLRDVPAGATIVVAVTEFATNVAAPAGSIADSASNSYSVPTGAARSLNNTQANGYHEIFRAFNVTALSAGSTITYTKSTSGTGTSIAAVYVTGVKTTDPIDSAVTASTTGNANPPNCSVTSGTPGVSNEIFIASVGHQSWSSSPPLFTQDQTNGWAAPFEFIAGIASNSDAVVNGGWFKNTGTGTKTFASSVNNAPGNRSFACVVIGLQPP